MDESTFGSTRDTDINNLAKGIPVFQKMTTRTKLNIASLTTSAIMTLNVFSHPLGIPQGIQTLISVVLFIPLWFTFVYIKELKKEKAAMVASGRLSAATVASDQEKTKKRLIYIWIGTVALSFSSPFWMPALSGTNLGPRINVIIAFTSAAMISLIFGVRLLKDFRKDLNAPPKWRILYIAAIAYVFIAIICSSMVPAAKNNAQVVAYNKSGIEKANNGDFDGAIADYDRALELDPQVAGTFNNRGFARYSKGDIDGALADYNRSLDLDPKEAPTYSNRGMAKAQKGDLSGAIADYDQAINLDPKLANAYCNRGVAKSSSDPDGALDDSTQAIELNSSDTTSYINRASIKLNRHDFDAAIADYNYAINVDPRLAIAYRGLGSAKAQKGDFDGAIADLNKALELDSKSTAAYILRGAAKYRKNDLSGALEDFNSAIAIDPKVSGVYKLRSNIKAKMGDQAGANADLATARQLDPNVNKK